MSDYRVVSNGDKFRVQTWDWWCPFWFCARRCYGSGKTEIAEKPDAREYFLWDDRENDRITASRTNIFGGQAVHVIEKSAFDSLTAELAEQTKFLRSCLEERDSLDKMLVESKAELFEAREENARLKEVISYLPKVPTQPYEKELAKQIQSRDQLIDKCERALILSGSKILGYREIFNHELNLAEFKEDLTEAVKINKQAITAIKAFREGK